MGMGDISRCYPSSLEQNVPLSENVCKVLSLLPHLLCRVLSYTFVKVKFVENPKQ